MKKKLSTEFFKIFIENLSVVKECKLSENNEAVIVLNNGNKIVVLLAVADTGYPKQVKNIISNIRPKTYLVILAPYISRQTGKLCNDSGVGYLDLSGNCFIVSDCLYIEIKGNKNENIPKRQLKSIYERSSVVSSVILRIMLEDVKRTWKMQELADAANCSIGQVAKVKEFLLNQDYLEQTEKGFRITNPRELIKDWAAVYNSNSEERIACYSLEKVPALESMIARMKEETGIECILTGFSGGSRYQPVVRYQKVHAYIEEKDLEKAMDYLGLKRVESGANVVFIIAYNSCVKYDAKFRKDNMVVSPVQLYLDCMSINGRGEEMAEIILEREICK